MCDIRGTEPTDRAIASPRWRVLSLEPMEAQWGRCVAALLSQPTLSTDNRSHSDRSGVLDAQARDFGRARLFETSARAKRAAASAPPPRSFTPHTRRRVRKRSAGRRSHYEVDERGDVRGAGGRCTLAHPFERAAPRSAPPGEHFARRRSRSCALAPTAPDGVRPLLLLLGSNFPQPRGPTPCPARTHRGQNLCAWASIARAKTT